MDTENMTSTETSAVDSFEAGLTDTEATTTETVVEETSTQTSESEETSDGTAKSDATPDSASEKADEPAQTEKDTGEAKAATEGEKTPTETKLHVKYMDEEKDLTMEEAQAYAQKGMDYDRIRQKYDESKPVVELMTSLAQKSGMNVADFVNYIRLQTKRQEGMNEADAKHAVELEDREAEISRKEESAKAETAEQEKAKARDNDRKVRIAADKAHFQAKFPDMKDKLGDLPQSVWDAVGRGESLVEAYQDYLIAQKDAEATSAKQNAKNAVASSGSMATAGNERKSKESFLDGYGE